MQLPLFSGRAPRTGASRARGPVGHCTSGRPLNPPLFPGPQRLRILRPLLLNTITTAIKLARKWAAPRPRCLSPGTRTRSLSRQAAGTTQWADTIDWAVRCDWLQVASSRMMLCTHNTMPMRAATLVQVLQDLL